jgi:hypothetical protein
VKTVEKDDQVSVLGRIIVKMPETKVDLDKAIGFFGLQESIAQPSRNAGSPPRGMEKMESGWLRRTPPGGTKFGIEFFKN